MNFLKILLDNIGYAFTLAWLVTLVWGVYLWASGILPALLRLGNGLAMRRIAIFANGEHLRELSSLLLDTDLFNSKNIIEIQSDRDIGRSEQASVYLIYWHDWEGHIDEILSRKPDKCPMIIYSPYEEEKIPIATMRKIDGSRNTSVTNFRGRLLNDIVTAMITTSYDKR